MTEKLSVRKREAAAMLSVSERTLDRLVATGEIPSVKLEGVVLFRVAALREWLEKRERRQEAKEG